MEANRVEHDTDATKVSSREDVLRYSRRFTAASKTLPIARRTPTEPQSLEAALNEVASPALGAEGKGTFHGLGNRPEYEKRLALRNLRPLFCSSARLKYTVHEYIASSASLVEDAVVRLFGDVGRVTISNPR